MEKKKCILVIEDELMVQQSLVENLSAHGFDSFAFSTAEDAMASPLLPLADLVIMDIQLPGISGLEATERIKKDNTRTPVIMLTAYSDVRYRIQGLETGADDYIIKPFFMEELLARIKMVLKRYELVPGGTRYFEIADLQIDVRAKSAFRNRQPLKLSLTEFNLLAFLADCHGDPVSKEEIQKKVWKGKYSVGDNTIEVYINLLRNKVDKPFSRKLIHTRPGFGYYLSEER